MFKNGKVVKSFVLASLLASTSLAALSPVTAEATPAPQEVVDKLENTTPTSIESGIEYTDVNGYTQKYEIPSDVAVEVNANSKRIIVKFNKVTKYLDNVKDVTLKNITISNAVAFNNLKTVEKITVDNVTFRKSIDFDDLKAVKEIVVKNSTFGVFAGYSLAVHGAPQLKTFLVDNSEMKADFRVYSNKSLGSASVSNSLIVGHAKQEGNSVGYKTNYYNTTFKRSGDLQKVYTDGKSVNARFDINPEADVVNGDSKFNASKPGKISYVNRAGAVEDIDVPAHVYIKEIDDKGDRIFIKFSNNKQYWLDGTLHLTFRNIEFRTNLEFTSRNLFLQKLEIINSRIRNAQVWNSDTLTSFKISGTDMNDTNSLVQSYNNKVQNTFSIQDSKIANVKAKNLPSIKDKVVQNTIGQNANETGFSLYNVYTKGYVYTCKLGLENYGIPVYNSTFDNYIAATNTISGDAIRKTVGYAPTLEGPDSLVRPKSEPVTTESLVANDLVALDKEDGDITSSITFLEDLSTVDSNSNDDYTLTAVVTDSDGNTVYKEVTFSFK